MIIAAIDLGLKGAIAWQESDGDTGCVVMPTITGKAIDWMSVIELLHGIGRAYVEGLQVFKTRKFSTTPNTAMKMGEQLGYIQGIALGSGMSLVVVQPRTWQKMLIPMRNGTTKQRSVLTAQQLYPDFDLRFNKRFKNPHDGAADALCILDWGVRHSKGLA